MAAAGRALRIAVTVFLLLTMVRQDLENGSLTPQLLFIAAIGCAAAARDGVDFAGAVLQTSSVHAGYALFGLCMGVVTCLVGLILVWWPRIMNVGTLVLVLNLCVFFADV